MFVCDRMTECTTAAGVFASMFLLTGIRDAVVWHLLQETWAQFRPVPRSVCPAVGKHSPLLHPLLRLASVKRADITNRQHLNHNSDFTFRGIFQFHWSSF